MTPQQSVYDLASNTIRELAMEEPREEDFLYSPDGMNTCVDQIAFGNALTDYKFSKAKRLRIIQCHSNCIGLFKDGEILYQGTHYQLVMEYPQHGEGKLEAHRLLFGGSIPIPDTSTMLGELTDKQHIEKLKDGECYTVPESDYGKAEIWLKNETYFLFEIPMYGGNPHFGGYFNKHRIDDLIATYQSWT